MNAPLAFKLFAGLMISIVGGLLGLLVAVALS